MKIEEIQEYQQIPNRNIFASLLLLAGFLMLGLVLGNLVGITISLPLFDADYETMVNAFVDPATYPDSRRALLIVQACNSLFGFILAPLAFYVLIEKGRPDKLLHSKRVDAGLILLVGLIVLTFMVANSMVIEWNMSVDLGQLSPAFEEWASGKEEQLRELTEYLTRFESIGGLLVGMIVIAVLPAIGEELVFRGLGQRMLHGLTHNHHAGIWISAFLFSFIHLQFYGFFPRFLLGALFGYIYWWSGSLWYPIFAHFANNGFTLVMLYMYQQQVTELNVEDTESVPVYTALVALAATLGMLYYFKTRFLKISATENGW